MLANFIDHFPGRHGSSLFRQAELEALASVLRYRLLRSTSMLEIGTYEGVTASLLAETCPQSRIVSIDPFMDHDDKDPRRRLGIERLQNWRLNQRPNQWLWVGTMQDFHTFSHHDFDLVLVDGGHAYEEVLSDLRYASGMLLPDAYIAVHDYADPQWSEVTAATDAFLAPGEFKIERVVESMAMLRRARQ